MKTKVAVLFAGALVALLLVSRYFALSQVGLPLAWMLYLGLPITAAGVLFALRLINLGAGWTAKDMKHDLGAPARYPFCRRKRRPPSASRSSRRYTRKAQSLTSSTARGACTSSPRSDADGGWPALGQSLPRGRLHLDAGGLVLPACGRVLGRDTLTEPARFAVTPWRLVASNDRALTPLS